LAEKFINFQEILAHWLLGLVLALSLGFFGVIFLNDHPALADRLVSFFASDSNSRIVQPALQNRYLASWTNNYQYSTEDSKERLNVFLEKLGLKFIK